MVRSLFCMLGVWVGSKVMGDGVVWAGVRFAWAAWRLVAEIWDGVVWAGYSGALAGRWTDVDEGGGCSGRWVRRARWLRLGCVSRARPLLLLSGGSGSGSGRNKLSGGHRRGCEGFGSGCVQSLRLGGWAMVAVVGL